MFKKSIIGLALVLSSATAIAAPALPFVGKRYFNFMGGSGTGESIHISKTGKTIIESCGKFSCIINYRGQFKNVIPAPDGFYKFTSNKVYWIQRNGELMRGCSGEDSDPCVAELYKI